jgi:ParB-like chromosome segregation protein Spo0J
MDHRQSNLTSPVNATEWPFHRFANIFPLMEGEAFEELVADIKANGLCEPIGVWDGEILDGRNRFNACKRAGVPLIIKGLDFSSEKEALAYVLSRNLKRRHLTFPQRSLIAAKVATLKRGQTQIGTGADLKTKAQAANMLDVSTRSVGYAKAVLKSSDLGMIAAVEKGEIGLRKAAEIVQRSAEAHDRLEPDLAFSNDDPGPASAEDYGATAEPKPEPLTKENHVSAAEVAAWNARNPGPIMMQMRQLGARLDSDNLAQLVVELLRSHPKVKLKIAAQTDVMVEFGKVEAAVDSVRLLLRSDIRDSLRRDLVRSALASFKSPDDRDQFIKEIKTGVRAPYAIERPNGPLRRDAPDDVPF